MMAGAGGELAACKVGSGSPEEHRVCQQVSVF